MINKKRKILIANWKMNGQIVEGMRLIKQIRIDVLRKPINCDLVICPPFTLLRDMAEKVPGTGIKIGGQNCHHESEGAFTGEVSAKMLREITCDYVIVGHSERRHQHGESSEFVKKKAKAAIEARLNPIICLGETMYERDNDLMKVVIREQLLHSIPENANDDNIIIAYEPVWAIGSGLTPTTDQIEEMHLYIRSVIKDELRQFENGVRVVYGGSANGDNAQSILSIKDVDGLLVGKASLDLKQFWKMIETANHLVYKA